MRFRIEARCKRGEQPSYTYVIHDRVKPGKVQRLVDGAILDIVAHEQGQGSGPLRMPHFDWGEDLDGYATPSVTIGILKARIIVTPIHEGVKT